MIYFAYAIHVFWMQNIFSGQSGKKLDKVSRDPRTGKGIIMVKYHVPTLYHVENYCCLVYSLNLCKEWCIFLMTFFSHTREEFLCCQCMEKGEDEAGWSRSWPQQTILGCWTSQYCALKTTDFLLNYFLLHSYIHLLYALENFVRMFLSSFKI